MSFHLKINVFSLEIYHRFILFKNIENFEVVKFKHVNLEVEIYC